MDPQKISTSDIGPLENPDLKYWASKITWPQLPERLLINLQQ